MKIGKALLLLFVPLLATLAFAQSESKTLLSRSIRLADGEFHKFEIRSAGVFLDDRLKAKTDFDSFYPIVETSEYWELGDEFFDNGSTGIWFLFGTRLATGICGMPNYAVVHLDSKGNIKASNKAHLFA